MGIGKEPAKDKYNEEQRQIVETIFDKEWRENVKGQKWSKYNGDMTLLVIKYYLEKYLKPNSLAVSLNSYVEDFPTEFDLIIHETNAKPRQFTHAFNGNDVYALIEVKAKGIFGDVRKEIPAKASKIRENFDKIREKFRRIKCCYLTIRETINPKKPTSVNYGKLARKGLRPYRFYCLKDTRTKELVPSQWKSFLKELKLA